MANRTIIAVDDEADILDLIRYTFTREGFEVLTAGRGEEAVNLILAQAARTPPACVLLDLMLPGMDGMTICRKLKSRDDTKRIPVIMLTAKTSESDIVAGLELGADDYVTKPFSPRVLVARVRAALRKAEDAQETTEDRTIGTGSPNLMVVGELQIDLARHEVKAGGRIFDLSATEFMILSFLAENPGWVFSRNRIIDGVRGKDYPVTERSVDVQVLGLRKKLGSYGEYLQTVRGVGYRLQAPDTPAGT